MSSVKLAILHY